MLNHSISKPTNRLEKKVFRFQVAVIASIILFINESSVLAKHQPTARRDSLNSLERKCDFIARVVNDNDLERRAGSKLCEGDKLQVANGSTVKILCYLNLKFLDLPSGSISNTPDKCVPQAMKRRCTPATRKKCPKTKGPGDENGTPMVISPYGSSILNSRPVISWYSVAGADNYTVVVEGNGVIWEKEVKTTTLLYPKEQRELQYGNAYKITVLASKGDFPVSADTSVVNLLPESDLKQILEKVEQINSLNLPPDEAAFLDLDAVYMSRRLLNETINTLKKRVVAGSSNPTLYRILGDRYLEAWLTDEARREYTMAAQLAQSSGSLDELEKVQERLKLFESLQQP
ncbi:MAG: hypothetical protein HWQ35_34300 [Nostoc sp. NMS1]|uniref:hypothetical protein n=1 Tax=Nostoc sp. NMS1 TaxID=2815388 RepID=UPI0025E56CB5|nr:hypothetical protein [Nostoc sp. NMS1]MBN3911427.1 hypothetical protein [Nostoc sp. NMS1]